MSHPQFPSFHPMAIKICRKRLRRPDITFWIIYKTYIDWNAQTLRVCRTSTSSLSSSSSSDYIKLSGQFCRIRVGTRSSLSRFRASNNSEFSANQPNRNRQSAVFLTHISFKSNYCRRVKRSPSTSGTKTIRHTAVTATWVAFRAWLPIRSTAPPH